MSLASGFRIGAYEVVSAIGAGGMGEVYKARDTRLNRSVAIKVLPDLVAADPERAARFEREAQVLAALNHPHIGAIYGVEVSESGKSRYLILEFIDGESLAGRLAKGALPFDEAIALARQMLDALEAAHEKGIVHRDLKPANLMLTGEGQLKVLDFGLARVIDGDPTASVANSPTLTFAATQAGVIMGTASYMAPEQAKGRAADRRADVWAFGCVFYEMLCGKRVFEGDDVSEILAAVLRADPDWHALPDDVPPGVRSLIKRCLERDRKQRIPEISTVRFLLQDALAAPAATASPTAVVVAPPRPLWKRALPIAAAAVAAGALGLAAAWWLRPAPAVSVHRFSVTLPEGHTYTSPGRHSIASSPDGSRIAYIAQGQLFVRALSEFEAKPVQGSDAFGSIAEVVFSPDSQWLAFYAPSDQTLKRVAVTGGAAVTIGPATNPLGMNWDESGLIFGQASKGIVRVSPNGGTQQVLIAVADPERSHGPQLLPGGETVLFTLATGSNNDRWDRADIVAQNLKTGARKRLLTGGSDARYVSTGHLLYALGGTLFAVPFDLKRLEVTGGPVPLIEGVRRAPGTTTGAAQYSLSTAGALAYIPGPTTGAAAQLEIVVADRDGKTEVLKLPPGPYQTPRVSPDGKRIAFSGDDKKESVIWTFELAGTSAMQRLTFGGNNSEPTWSSDSKRVAFQSDREGDFGIFWQPADGTGTAERLTKPSSGEAHSPQMFSPAGAAHRTLLYDIRKGADVALWMLSLADGKAASFGDVRSSISPTGAVFSPDGRWVAYTTTTAARTTVTVQPFPATGARYEMVTRGTDGPHEVTWSPTGKELFYNPRPGGFEVVPVVTQPTFAFGVATAVPRSFTLGPPPVRRSYDVLPNGKFVGTAAQGTSAVAGQTTTAPIYVVLNWFEELKTRVSR